jgi:hypothetical protein
MCGAPVQELDPVVAAATETVIQGTVSRAGTPVSGAYVRLLDGTGEFTAEVQTSVTGAFRFFAAPGEWTLRAIAPRAGGQLGVRAHAGRVTTVTVQVE